MADNEINDINRSKLSKIKENEKVQCIIPIMENGKEESCNTSYKFTGSTSYMKYHLNEQKNTISSMFGRVIPHVKSQQYKLDVVLLEFIITDSQPFHILRFKKFPFHVTKFNF
nr:10472_t:CDS:2 [Entrophospora candida]